MMTLITNQEDASEKFHTHAPPRANAQRNPYKMELTWLYKEISVVLLWSSTELGLRICQLSTVYLGYPYILQLYCNCTYLNCKHSSLLKQTILFDHPKQSLVLWTTTRPRLDIARQVALLLHYTTYINNKWSLSEIWDCIGILALQIIGINIAPYTNKFRAQ